MRAFWLLVGLALMPFAHAQESVLSLSDPSLDAFPPPANAYADITGASLEIVDGKTLRASVTIHVLPEPHPGMGYGVVFTAGERTLYAALVTIPDPVFLYGRWDEGPADSKEATGSYSPGPSGTVIVEFPLAAIPEALAVSDPIAMSMDVKGSAPGLDGVVPFFVLDEAVGKGSLAIPGREPGATPAGETAAPSAASEDASPAAADDAAPAATADGTPAAPAGREIPGGGAVLALVAGAVAAVAAALAAVVATSTGRRGR